MKLSCWIGILSYILTVVSATAQEELNYRAFLQEDVPSVAIRCITQA